MVEYRDVIYKPPLIRSPVLSTLGVNFLSRALVVRRDTCSVKLPVDSDDKGWGKSGSTFFQKLVEPVFFITLHCPCPMYCIAKDYGLQYEEGAILYHRHRKRKRYNPLRDCKKKFVKKKISSSIRMWPSTNFYLSEADAAYCLPIFLFNLSLILST